MKTIKLNKLFFAILLAITTLTVSCGKDEAIVKENSKIDTSDIMLSIGKGKDTISFYAAADWTAALSTTSWIKIDPMTRAGVKGEAKVIIEWEANASVKERIADLTIAVRDENPVKIRLTQLPEQAMLIVDKTDLDLVVKPGASNGRGQFVDTISVKSNIKWTLKNMPAWIDYSTVGDKEPQDGVVTDIKLVISADPKKFDKTVMSSEFKLGKSDNTETDATINVSAETILKAVDADKNPVTGLVIKKSVAANNKFVASFHLVANTSWKLKSAPKWVDVSQIDNNNEYANKLQSDIVVWFTMTNANLDSDPKSGKAIFVNEQTNTELSVDLAFEGTGANFFEYEIDHTPDQLFNATKYDENWNPIPGAVLAKELIMFTANDYLSLGQAPFKAHFVQANNGIPTQQEALWIGLDFPAEPFNGRSPLISKKLEVYVQDRMNDSGDKFSLRHALMIITPSSVSFNDMFNENGELKPEYSDASVLFGQQAMPRPPFNSNIPETVSFTAKGGEQAYEIYSASNMTGSNISEHPWIDLTFERSEGDIPVGLVVKTKPNTTGVARSEKVIIHEYVAATDSDETVYEFTVTQAAE